jgi:hypothetical protein
MYHVDNDQRIAKCAIMVMFVGTLIVGAGLAALGNGLFPGYGPVFFLTGIVLGSFSMMPVGRLVVKWLDRKQ